MSVAVASERRARAEEAHAKVLKACRLIRGTWVVLAGLVFEVERDELWKALGNRSFEEWLATPEIEIKRDHALKMAKLWREYVVERGVDPNDLRRVDMVKLDNALPAVKAGLATPDEVRATRRR